MRNSNRLWKFFQNIFIFICTIWLHVIFFVSLDYCHSVLSKFSKRNMYYSVKSEKRKLRKKTAFACSWLKLIESIWYKQKCGQLGNVNGYNTCFSLLLVLHVYNPGDTWSTDEGLWEGWLAHVFCIFQWYYKSVYLKSLCASEVLSACLWATQLFQMRTLESWPWMRKILSSAFAFSQSPLVNSIWRWKYRAFSFMEWMILHKSPLSQSPAANQKILEPSHEMASFILIYCCCLIFTSNTIWQTLLLRDY